MKLFYIFKKGDFTLEDNNALYSINIQYSGMVLPEDIEGVIADGNIRELCMLIFKLIEKRCEMLMNLCFNDLFIEFVKQSPIKLNKRYIQYLKKTIQTNIGLNDKTKILEVLECSLTNCDNFTEDILPCAFANFNKNGFVLLGSVQKFPLIKTFRIAEKYMIV